MSGRNPMSSIRSASSRTTWTMSPEVERPALDVVEHAAGRADDDVDALLAGRGAAARSARRRRCRRPRLGRPTASFCSSTTICWTSSRVGARMMAWGPRPRASSISMSGMPNAAVLPVPVLAWPMTSRPSSALGMKAAWMGVGWVYRACLRALSMVGLRSIDRNPRRGLLFNSSNQSILRSTIV